MKKIFLFLASFCLIGGGLVSCGEVETFEVTYRSAVNNLHQLNYSRLSSKINDTKIKESFVLFTYNSDNPGCSCWLNFKNYLIDTYIPETHNLFYYIGTREFQGQENTFGINTSCGQPTICFFNKGKLVKQYDYNNHKTIFDDPTAQYSEFKRVLKQFTTQQDNLFLFDKYENVVADMPSKSKAVFYAFKTSCPDCKEASSTVLLPYLQGKTLNNKIYLLDIDQYVGKAEYQSIKDALKLSNKTADFGYGDGYVPTFQYWEDGKIKDANVFFNDIVIKDDNKFIISDSFFTQERLPKLSYLDNVQTKVLKGLELPAEQVGDYEDEGTTYYYWKTEGALTYHVPLLEAFLAKYAI